MPGHTSLAIAMQKGGVGKSTTTLNLAGALAARGHDVLAIDGDPQGGLTIKLGHRTYYRNGEHSLYDVCSDQGDLDIDQLDELVRHGEEFDLVPSQLRNFLLEKALYLESGGVMALDRAIDSLDLDYDYVLVDTPPNLGPLSDGALLATENVVFPSEPNQVSQDSLWLLRREIGTLESKFSVDISSIAAVLNEVPPNETVSRARRDWFAETFGESNVFEVGDRAVIEHAIEYNTSVYAYDPEDAGYPWDTGPLEQVQDTYDQLAQHVEGAL